MAEYILPLSDVYGENARTAGLVAHDMALLLGAGLPVPEAFVLTADAYADRAVALALEDRLLPLWELDPGDTALIAGADEITALLSSEGVDAGLRDEINTAAEGLGGPLVDVRMSPSVASHDAAAIASLGWGAEYLPCEAAADAVAQCWAALWGSRQIVFRRRASIDPHSSVPWGTAVLVSAARSFPLRGTAVPTGLSGEGAEAWLIRVDPRLPSEREITVEREKEEKTGSPLTASQAEALMILTAGAAAALDELRVVRWAFDGAGFCITGIQRR
jgi:hypothetical protein